MLMLGDETTREGSTVVSGRLLRSARGLGQLLLGVATRVVAGPEIELGGGVRGAVAEF